MTSRFFFLSMTLSLVVILCACSRTSVSAFPQGDIGDPIGGRSKRDECSADFGVRILCERCAKYTKSNLAYKMCCDSDNLEVQSWCKAFLEYEISSK